MKAAGPQPDAESGEGYGRQPLRLPVLRKGFVPYWTSCGLPN